MTRFTNLVIISMTCFLIRYTIILPFLQSSSGSSLTDSAYALLVLAIVLIAAGGYIINDYFDIKIDAVNKPGKNVIGNTISKSTAIFLYIFVTLCGIIISYVFGEMAGLKYPILVFLLSAGLLYFYSSSYKSMFLVGNIIVSFLASLSVFITVMFDHHALQSNVVKTLVMAYGVFAFIMTLIREIIKDCEDMEGDERYGASTLPLVAGVKPARIITGILTLMVFSAILWIQIIQSQWEDVTPFLYVIIFIQLPLLILAFWAFVANSVKNDHKNSLLSKLIMITGIFSMFIFHISF